MSEPYLGLPPNYVAPVLDPGSITPTSPVKKLVYYYDEARNKILVLNQESENLSKISQAPSTGWERYGEVLLGYNFGGTTRTFNSGDGLTITVEQNQSLYLFYGNTKEIAGINSQTNYWKYNRHLHKPYKVYMLMESSPNPDGGEPVTKIIKSWVKYQKTPFNKNNGTYLFDTTPDKVLDVKAYVRYTTDDKLKNPSSTLQTWPYVELVVKKILNDGGEVVIANKTVNTATNGVPGTITINFKLDPNSIDNNKVAIGDRIALFVRVDGTPTEINNIQTGLVVTNYSLDVVFNGASSEPTRGNVFWSDYNLFSKAVDCKPVLNNIDEYPLNEFNYPLYYSLSSTGFGVPVNWDRVANNTQPKSNINSFMYYSTGMKSIRYDGSFTTSQRINKFEDDGDDNIISIGEDTTYSYGKLPNVEIRSAYFGYYDSLKDLYPLVNNKTLYNIKYSVGPNGDISSPIMDNVAHLNLMKSLDNKYDNNNLKIFADSSVEPNFIELNKTFKIYKIGLKPYPVFYSQISAKDYSRSLDLWGLKEILGPQPFNDYSFAASGSSSRGEGPEVVAENLSPDSKEALNVDGTADYLNTIYSTSTGKIVIPLDNKGPEGSGIGKPLSNNYKFYFEHSVPTSYIYDIIKEYHHSKRGGFLGLGRRKRWTTTETTENVGYYEFYIKGKGLVNPNTYSVYTNTSGNNQMGNKTYPLSNVKVTLNVYYESASSPTGYIIKSFDVTNTLTSISDSRNISTDNKVRINFNNNKIEEILTKSGLSKNDYQRGGSILFFGWKITGEINDTFVQGSEIETVVSGKLDPMDTSVSEVNPTNVFYPASAASYNIHYDEFKFLGTAQRESKTIELLTNEKYWNFAVGSDSKTKYNEIVFQINNGNKTFGQGLRQVDLKYEPTLSNAFQGGVEPSFTQFPKIEDSWEPQPGDEIRFGNNEEFTYTITAVTNPVNNGGKLKLTLNGDVNPNIDMNMFLIRRWKPNKGAIITDTVFPHTNPPKEMNTQGFLFPEYLAEGIEKDPNVILKDLSDKGIIN